MRVNSALVVVLLILVVIVIAVSRNDVNAQTRPQNEGVLPPQAYISDRNSSALERELSRLKESEARMGEAHPRLFEVRKRISELETELATFRAVPNPFARFSEQGVAPQDIVERLSEKELRILVIRLAVDVKDLRKRVAELEGFVLKR